MLAEINSSYENDFLKTKVGESGINMYCYPRYTFNFKVIKILKY